MIVTIDGPAGSGKSTVARKLAARLGIPYLDTGAMYRAIAFAASEAKVDFSDPDALINFARSLQLEVDCGPTHTRVRINGRDVTEAIRSMAVSTVTSRIARLQAIRDLLVEHQRRLGTQLGSLVSEGRDQGSAVFPKADAKFVLEAALETRAKRRFDEMTAEGEEVSIEAVTENLLSRDQTDSRQWQPLLESGDAIVLDTSELTIHEVIDWMHDRLAKHTPRTIH